jgi:hypothetical protein
MSKVGFEVLIAVVMNSTIFWDITPCSPSRARRRYGGTYRLHLQGGRINRARNKRESTLLVTCFEVGSLLFLYNDLEYGGDIFVRNVG